jgi:WS/DGAT C-terminal domain
VHERLAVLKSDRSAGIADVLVGFLAWLPLTWLSGWPGRKSTPSTSPRPTGGTAFNATLLSYRSNMDMGLNIDTGAVADPELLTACLVESLADLVAAGA